MEVYMKILIAMPHYFKAENGIYGSLRNPQRRITSLFSSIQSLYQLFQSPQCNLHIEHMMAEPANQEHKYQLDIVICTTQGCHLLAELPIPTHYYTHIPTKAEPRLLGFECQAVLRDHLGKYDYYCFMEDDLMIHDAQFFDKLQWFNAQIGNQNVLQPNRYEVEDIRSPYPFLKGYIDGDISYKATAHFQNVNEMPELTGNVMGKTVRFRRALNPHSGCYFLNAAQMEYWEKQPYFLDRDISFFDPMASAATHSVTKTFRLYKPAMENAYFLEVEHCDKAYLNQVGSRLKIAENLVDKVRQPR
jgi:hypothetical protein